MATDENPWVRILHASSVAVQEVREYTVAFLDILGFKSKIDNMDLAELAGKYERLIIQTDATNRPVSEFPGQPTLFPNHPVDTPYCQRFVFSDSIILISHDDSLQSCLMVVIYCWRLMQTMLAAGFLPRGAISYGKMHINPSQNIFLGNALTEAAKLEQIQEWVGACLHPSVLEKYPEIGVFLSALIKLYDVPIKGGKTKKLHTLNWRLNLVVEKGTRSLFNPVVYKKNAHALEYAAHSVSEGTYLNDKKAPIELRAFFIGGRRPPFPHGDKY